MIEDPDKQEDGSFLSRWSRRKQDQDKKPAGEQQLEENEAALDQTLLNLNALNESAERPLADSDPDLVSEASAEIEGEAPVLTDDDMPPIETLDEHSDYSGFMSPGVSDTLRKLALRKLFASAGFNIRDGLDDYDDDFTNFEPLGDLITSDMKHQAEMAEKRKREAEEKEAADKLAEEAEQKQEPASDAPEAEVEAVVEEAKDSDDDRYAASPDSGPLDSDVAPDVEVDPEQQKTKRKA
ncbi:MAG: DUF3306 domain-containing protein [bacterium]